MSAQTIQDRAKDLLNTLKQTYKGDKLSLDFTASQYIAGDHNKAIRREIIRQATGERKPLTQCGLHATVDTLKNSFDQLSIF